MIYVFRNFIHNYIKSGYKMYKQSIYKQTR